MSTNKAEWWFRLDQNDDSDISCVKWGSNMLKWGQTGVLLKVAEIRNDERLANRMLDVKLLGMTNVKIKYRSTGPNRHTYKHVHIAYIQSGLCKTRKQAKREISNFQKLWV